MAGTVAARESGVTESGVTRTYGRPPTTDGFTTSNRLAMTTAVDGQC